MDPAEYLDARWFSLLRDAADLGVPDDDASALVRRVLAANERRIRRADDPDPLVRAALRDAVLGPPDPGAAPRRRLPLVAIAAILVAVGVVVALTRPGPPPDDRLREDQVPSFFGYAVDDATAMLEERGLDVTLEPFRSCEVLDRVVATDPAPGTPFEDGDTVTVYAAVPSDVVCLARYQDRVAAWELLDFANGRGPAPAFADRVLVYERGERTVLDSGAAADPDGWSGTGVLEGLRRASLEVAMVSEHPLLYAVPAIRVASATSGLGSCGVPSPAVAGSGDAFAVIVRPPDREGCGERVDVFRDGDAIVAIAYYPAEP